MTKTNLRKKKAKSIWKNVKCSARDNISINKDMSSYKFDKKKMRYFILILSISYTNCKVIKIPDNHNSAAYWKAEAIRVKHEILFNYIILPSIFGVIVGIPIAILLIIGCIGGCISGYEILYSKCSKKTTADNSTLVDSGTELYGFQREKDGIKSSLKINDNDNNKSS